MSTCVCLGISNCVGVISTPSPPQHSTGPLLSIHVPLEQARLLPTGTVILIHHCHNTPAISDIRRELFYDFQNVFHSYFLIYLHNTFVMGTCVWQIKKLKLQDCKWRFQGCTVNKWQGQNGNLELLVASTSFSHYNLLSTKPHKTPSDVLYGPRETPQPQHGFPVPPRLAPVPV